jgi:FkbM family methyltransferase
MLVRLWKYRLREDWESIAFMRRQPLTGKTFIDVGANKGIYSYWMSRQTGPTGRVVAFEPQPDLHPHLLDFKRSFRLDNLEIVGKALSNRSGVLPMVRDKPGAVGASLEPEYAASDRRRETIAVEVTTLDEWIVEAKVSNVGFIKCDVEGHELAVFEGGLRLLERERPALLFECHHGEAVQGRLFQHLAERDFRGFFYHGRRIVPYERFAEIPYRKPTIHYRNYMFVPREKLADCGWAG